MRPFCVNTRRPETALVTRLFPSPRITLEELAFALALFSSFSPHSRCSPFLISHSLFLQVSLFLLVPLPPLVSFSLSNQASPSLSYLFLSIMMTLFRIPVELAWFDCIKCVCVSVGLAVWVWLWYLVCVCMCLIIGIRVYHVILEKSNELSGI